MLSVVCKFVPASYRSDTILQFTLNVLKVTAECGGLRMDFMLVGLFGLMNRPNESEMDTLIDAPIQMSCCSLTYKVFVNTHFTARCYASAVLAMGLCLCLSVCHKSEFY